MGELDEIKKHVRILAQVKTEAEAEQKQKELAATGVGMTVVITPGGNNKTGMYLVGTPVLPFMKPNPTPEDDMQLARHAFDSKNFHHAAEHVAAALIIDPLNTAYQEFFNTVIDAAPNPQDLIHLGQHAYYGFAAGRAYILLRQGVFDQAIDILLQVTATKPEVQVLSWILPHISNPHFFDNIKPELLLLRIIPLQQLPEGGQESEKMIPTWEAIESILAEFQKQKGYNEHILWIQMLALRRSRKYKECIALGEFGFMHFKSAMFPITMAKAYKLLGDFQGSVDMFRKASQIQPDNPEIFVDLGDTYLEMGDYKNSLESYMTALKFEPRHDWALPSAIGLNYILTGEFKHYEGLFALQNTMRGNERVGQMLMIALPWIGFIPSPEEATINLGRQLLANPEFSKSLGNPVDPKNVVESAVERPEAPSALMAFEQLLASHGYRMDLVIGKIPKPDPRQPWNNASFVLWQLEGSKLVPAFQEPDPSIAGKVAELAQSQYHQMIWRDEAKVIAKSIGLTGITSLIGTMVHPPPPFSEIIPYWDWIRRVQLAAALILGNIEENDAGFSALTSIIGGPIDWTTNAAIAALTDVAMRNPARGGEVIELFKALRKQMPKEGYWCVEPELDHHMLILPSIEEKMRKQILKDLHKS